MKLSFYLRYALRSLRRGGQRTFLAMICVAFGVMSVVSLQTLSVTISDTILMPSRTVLGGDALLSRSGQYISSSDITELERLRTTGQIAAYSVMYASGAMIRINESGQVHLLMWAMGVDPASYPLLGEVTLRSGSSLAAALQAPGSAVITRDAILKTGLKIGDTFVLNDAEGGVPLRLQLTDIVDTTHDHRGDKVMYSLDTARRLTGRSDIGTNALLLLNPKADRAVLDQLKAAGWSISFSEEHVNQESQDVFNFMLKGAGILGLLVGGIGVANTMQVLLARRTLEIAMLKTMGYRQRDLIALFGLETLLLGLAGSVLGAGGAVAFSRLDSLAQIGSMLVQWSIDPLLMIGGMLAGTAITVIFGVYAILRASAVRPAVLLRHLPTLRTWRTRLQAASIYLVLAIPFGLLSSVIMGSVLWGAAIIGVAVAGLIVLSIILGTALVVAIRLPTPSLPLLSLARNNLRRQKLRSIFALIALWAGVFAIGLAATTIRSGETELASRTWSNTGYNMLAITSPQHSEQIAAQFAQQGVQNLHRRYQVPLAVVQLGPEIPVIGTAELEGRADGDVTWDLTLTGDPWGSIPDGVYLPQRFQEQYPALKVGTPITVKATTGETQSLKIAGFYTAQPINAMLNRARGLLVSKDTALKVGGEVSITVIGAAPLDHLQPLTESLRRALPDATILNTAELNDVMNRMLKNLFIFAVSVAGLALVAGAVLIANSVGLAMVERRREVGVLKAVGYSSSDVLGTILLEHGLLGLLGGAIGVGGIAVAIVFINAAQPRSRLVFEALPMLATVLVAMVIALGSAAAVAWRPTRVRPLAILREE